MKLILKLVIIGFLFLLLVGVRFFETDLFYDPLIHFYEGNYLSGTMPNFNEWKLILHTAFRYGLNTFLSLLILWVAFQDVGTINFCLLFYGTVFVVLLMAFTYFVFTKNPENQFVLFYVRRFLVQPMFILLLLPAFYFQKHIKQ